MKVLQRLARIIAPPVCIRCGREDEVLCVACCHRLSQPPHPQCFGCRKYNKTGTTCPPCRRLTAVAGLTGAGTYDSERQELIRLLKYRRLRDVGDWVASELAPLLEPSNFDVVTAVPAATNRYRQRGFNQAELIARSLAKRLGLPHRVYLRRLSNVRQVGHSRSRRLQQAGTTFEHYRQPPRRVLLIDDVLTTGATLDACARLLARRGALVWTAVAAIRE